MSTDARDNSRPLKQAEVGTTGEMTGAADGVANGGRFSTGVATGAGWVPRTDDGLAPHLAEKARTPLWRDKRALVGGAVAALILAGAGTVAHQWGLAATTVPALRPIIGTTVIIKPELVAPRPNVAAAATALAPPPQARPADQALPEVTVAPAEGPPPPAAAAPAADTPPPDPATDRRPASAAAKPAHERAPIRHPVAVAHPAHARSLGATSSSTVTTASSAAAVAPVESARAPEAAHPRLSPTSDLKKRVPLVDDHPRVEILE